MPPADSDSSDLIAHTPPPPYYAVIFTSLRAPGGDGDYAKMAAEMEELAAKQPGFLGLETAREKTGITVSYWRDLEAINRWKENLRHREAQRQGREKWYAAYFIRIAKVERDYDFEVAV